MSNYEYPVERVSITYSVITDFDPGVMSEPFQMEKGGPMVRNDMGTGPHPFSAGFRTPEAAEDTMRRALEYVRSLGTGRVWVEKVTETTLREKLWQESA
jgi:hypothetical protein